MVFQLVSSFLDHMDGHPPSILLGCVPVLRSVFIWLAIPWHPSVCGHPVPVRDPFRLPFLPKSVKFVAVFKGRNPSAPL